MPPPMSSFSGMAMGRIAMKFCIGYGGHPLHNCGQKMTESRHGSMTSQKVQPPIDFFKEIVFQPRNFLRLTGIEILCMI